MTSGETTEAFFHYAVFDRIHQLQAKYLQVPEAIVIALFHRILTKLPH